MKYRNWKKQTPILPPKRESLLVVEKQEPLHRLQPLSFSLYIYVSKSVR